jgi:hypothetical protein
LATNKNRNASSEIKSDLGTERINKRLDTLDLRLDNIDSIMTSLVERVMQQPLSMEVSCPKCGQAIQISIMSKTKLKG